MKNLKRRVIPFVVAFAYTMSFPAGVLANGNSAGELLKYFNPIQKKGYLNQSQDRLIKKKKFKISELPPSPPVRNKELGFFAILTADKLHDAAYAEKLLSSDRVNGLSATLTWSQLEPNEGEFKWEDVDKLLALCNQHQKSLILRVATCGVDPVGSSEGSSDTPKWVYDQGVKSLTYTGVDGKPHQMPLFWDTTYMAKWGNFVKALAKRYDQHPDIHSIGITGGGFGGGTPIVPPLANASKEEIAKLTEHLKLEHEMDRRKIVEHWKYVADLFPKRFQHARLNFDINPTTKNRAGQDCLDEISDYLVYRYGERVYLTRHNATGKHGFDDYRIILKFRNDTLNGLQLAQNVTAEDMTSIAKYALDDGISYLEVPPDVLLSEDATIKAALDKMANHLGYQLVGMKATLPKEAGSGQPIPASFGFVNVGAATAMRPERNLDKDVPTSYKVQIELRDNTGKPVVQNMHTPGTPTSKWTGGEEITWEEELKMPPLPPGDYTAYMSLIDPATKRKIAFLNAMTEKQAPALDVELGSIKITAESPLQSKLLESNATKTKADGK